MFYDQEEQAEFWAALDQLDALGMPERVGAAVNILTSWALRDPTSAPQTAQGIRVLKLPSTYLLGGMTPPLRLAFWLDPAPRPSGAAGVVLLMDVSVYDEAQELMDGGFAPVSH